MSFRMHVESNVALTPRVAKLREIFDLPMVDKVERDWDVEIPEDDFEWNVGLVVGPSGSGKSQLARHLWDGCFAENYEWPREGAVIDGFAEELDVNEVSQLLTNVGFSSPPSWLRPFHTLSNGEQFRANLARAIVDPRELVIIDEFTSVVDRTVAQIGSCAFAREIRKRNKHVILLSCHYDVIDWLQPDWIYYVDEGRFERRSLQRRPPIDVEVRQCAASMWKIFSPHHYLTAKLPGGSHCMVGLVRGRPAVFTANTFFPLSTTIDGSGIRHVSRAVCLPDFQGIGLGIAFKEFTSSLWKSQGWRITSIFAHPALYASSMRRPNMWKCIRKKGNLSAGKIGTIGKGSARRATWTFEYVGPAGDPEIARKFEIYPQ